MGTVASQGLEQDPANWITEWAIDAMRTFAGPHLYRSEAVQLIAYWKHAPSLTVREMDVVLTHFPVRQPLPEHHGYKIGNRHPKPDPRDEK